MVNPNDRDIAHSDPPGRLDPAVAGYDSVFAVDKDWINKSEMFDADRNLCDLPLAVGPRIVCP